MITQIRVDDRLIHGQIALVWSKALGTNKIVVVNDSASTNETTKMTLSMAVPQGIKLMIRSVADAIPFFNSPKAKDAEMFVLVSNVKDALSLVQGCPGLVKAVNIANVGKFDGIPMSEKTAFLSGFFTEVEIESCRELVKFEDIAIYHQITPEKAQTSVKKALEDAGLDKAS